jgi:predicted lactoylglutathione lyase
MTTPAHRPRMTAITLGVRDPSASARFYEALGFIRKFRATGDEIAFIDAGGVVLALWDWQKLANDAQLSAEAAPTTFRGSTLAWNCRTDDEVDAAFARALAAGAKALRRPEQTDYGGYRGYFGDPDGHVWEVVRAPGFKFDASGALILPD